MDRDILQRYFFVGLLFAVSVVVFFIFLPFLEVMVLAGIFTVVLLPLHKRITTNLNGKRGLAAFIVIMIFAVVVIIPFILLSTLILGEAKDVYVSLTTQDVGYMERLTDSIERPIQSFYPTFSIDFGDLATRGADWLVGHFTTVVSKVFAMVTGIVLIFFSMYFFLRDGRKFKEILVKLSPLSDEYDQQIFSKIKLTVSATVKGVLLISIIQGILSGIGMFIFGVPNPFLWGSISAVASLVPGFGTALVFIPAVAYLYTTGSAVMAFGLLIWGVIIVGLVDNILMPYLYSREIEIHPLIILFAVLGGLIVFGPIGFIFGPIILGLFFSLIEIYQSIILKKKTL